VTVIRDPWADWQDISATAEPLTPSYLLLARKPDSVTSVP